jgi:hypothetical protein
MNVMMAAVADTRYPERCELLLDLLANMDVAATSPDTLGVAALALPRSVGAGAAAAAVYGAPASSSSYAASSSSAAAAAAAAAAASGGGGVGAVGAAAGFVALASAPTSLGLTASDAAAAVFNMAATGLGGVGSGQAGGRVTLLALVRLCVSVVALAPASQRAGDVMHFFAAMFPAMVRAYPGQARELSETADLFVRAVVGTLLQGAM